MMTPPPVYNIANMHYQASLDKLVPFIVERWSALGITLVLLFLRIVFARGYYVVAYALGIYLLNMFLLFLSPKFDPAFLDDEAADSLANNADIGASASDLPALPLQSGVDDSGEYRPFIRRLPEFKFWHESFRASVFALVASFIPFFDIPVFWPILLLYFVILFTMTMRRQISHMIKYKYVPFDMGKQNYAK
jgi:hypothetical protein